MFPQKQAALKKLNKEGVTLGSIDFFKVGGGGNSTLCDTRFCTGCIWS